MKKTRFIFLTLLTVIFAWTVFCGFTAPKATTELFVADYADVISEEDESHIIKMSASLEKVCKAQIAVLTTNDIQGLDIEEYSRRTANEWGLGDKEKDNGVLIVLNLGDDRGIWVAVGTGLEGRLNDGKVGRFIDNYAMDDLVEGNYSEGVTHLYDEILNSVMLEYDIESLDGVETHEEEDDIGGWVFLVLVAILITVFILMMSNRNGRRFIRSAIYYGMVTSGSSKSSGSSGWSGGGHFGGGGGFSGGGAGRHF